MKLLLHVGLHRAASTAIQDWLIGHSGLLAEQGCFIAAGPQTGLEGESLNILTGQSFAEVPEEAMAEFLADELDERQPRYTSGVLSDENMPGLMPNAARAPFYRAERLARILGHLAKRHEVMALIVLREHVAWMISLYRVAQIRGETADFEAFSRTVAARPDLFASLVAPVTAAIGLEHAIVTSQEAIAADQGRGVLAKIGAALGVTLPPDAVLTRKNASRNPLVCTLMQDAARQGLAIDLRAVPNLSQFLETLCRDRESPAPDDLERGARLLRRATKPLAEGGAPLRLTEAQTLLAGALERSRQPVASHTLTADLRDYFAVDRAWIRTHHPEAILEE